MLKRPNFDGMRCCQMFIAVVSNLIPSSITWQALRTAPFPGRSYLTQINQYLFFYARKLVSYLFRDSLLKEMFREKCFVYSRIGIGLTTIVRRRTPYIPINFLSNRFLFQVFLTTACFVWKKWKTEKHSWGFVINFFSCWMRAGVAGVRSAILIKIHILNNHDMGGSGGLECLR